MQCKLKAFAAQIYYFHNEVQTVSKQLLLSAFFFSKEKIP